MKYLFTSLLIVLVSKIVSQNLILNSSFELSKPRVPSDFDMKSFRIANEKEFKNKSEGFFSVDGSSPDIIDSKNKKLKFGDYGDTIISNFKAKHGDIAIGIRIYGCKDAPLFCREYLIIPFFKRLVKGNKYVLEFWYGRMVGSPIVPLNLFYSDTILTFNPNYTGFKIKPYTVLKIDTTSKAFEWTLYNDTIVAKSDYKFLTIGNFFNDEKTKVIFPKNEKYFPRGYYFLDNFSLIPINAVEKTNLCIFLKHRDKPDTITLNEFDFNSADLYPMYYRPLDSVLSLIQNKPEDYKIKILGHTDNVGTTESNQKLSALRAKSVFDYLEKKGANTSFIEYEGCGNSKPKYDNTTEVERKKNRRVEIIINRK